MSKEGASKWIRGYMDLHRLSLMQVSRDLNIPQERLSYDCDIPFSADEFLSLCAYLGVDLDRLLRGANDEDSDE